MAPVMSSPGSRNGQAHGSPQGRPILRVGRKGFFIGRASGCRATWATPRDSSPPPVCLSVLLCGPGRRTCQGHSGNTHILHIACRWHGQWQQDWRVRQAVVSDMREGKRAPRGRRPAIVHETQGVGSSGQSRTSPAGSDDNADILYQPAGVFAPLHHDALGARHPRVQTRDASHHDAPHGTRPMQAGRMPDN